MANPWFRLYSEFATDPKVQMLSEALQRRLIMLFCFRCSNDNVTLQDDEVTFMLRISNEEWQKTKQIFIEKGFINSQNEVLNWDKRQFKSDTSKDRVARLREKRKKEKLENSEGEKCNVTVTPPEADTETDITTTNTSAPDLMKNWKELFISYGYKFNILTNANVNRMCMFLIENKLTKEEVQNVIANVNEARRGSGNADLPTSPCYYQPAIKDYVEAKKSPKPLETSSGQKYRRSNYADDKRTRQQERERLAQESQQRSIEILRQKREREERESAKGY